MRNKIKQLIAVIFFFVSIGATAQTVQDTLFVTGVVSDASTGKPLQGIQLEINREYQALSNENGHYRLRVPNATALMKLSAPGFAPRQVALQGKLQKDIVMYRNAFVSVKDEANYTMSPALAVDEELQTRFAGDVRSISRSGAMGIGANRFIRGYNSVNANAQPLLVVDGVVWDNPSNRQSLHQGYYINSLLGIDIHDIENIEVQKDASSLYGSKGANGVIRIKTFGVKDQVTRAAFDASFGVNFTPNYPRLMNAGQYRSYASELMKEYPGDIESLNMFNDDPSRIYYNKYHNETDWKDEIIRNGNILRYGLNVSGGDDKAKYYFALGYTNGLGTVKETDFTRFNARINSDIHLSKQLDVVTTIYYTNLSRKLFDDGVDTRTNPVMSALVKSPFLHPQSYTTDGSRLTNQLEDADEFGYSNPVALIRDADGSTKQYRFGIGVEPAWSINKHLKLTDLFSYTLDNLKERAFIPMNGTAPVLVAGGGISENTAKDQTIEQTALFNETKLTFNKIFNYNHTVSALAGARISVNQFKSAYIEGHNTGNDRRRTISNSLDFKQLHGENEEWNSVSYYLGADYSFKERYSIGALVDMDASSRFGTETKDGFRLGGTTYAVFPSAKAAWLVSGESFMNQLPFINRLELHIGYGITGNDDIANMARYAYLSPVNYLGSGVGLVIANLQNAALQWETTTKQSIGFDLSVWNDRISLSSDFYKHTTANLLTLKQAPDLSGLAYYWSNAGQLENTGYDLGLAIKVLNLKDFKWNMELSASHYLNKITALPDGKNYTTSICNGEILTSVNNPAGLFYGYKSYGVFASDEEAMQANNSQGLRKQNRNASYSYFLGGDIHFDDLDGNGIINELDKQVIGDPNPDFTGSMAHRFAFGPFGLDVFFTYSTGGDIYNYQRRLLESGSNFSNQSTELINRWKSDGQTTSVPRITYGDPMDNSRFSDRWIEDASYLKLKELRLTYKIPTQIPYIQGLSLWLAGTNLYTWTKYLGPDPEVSMNTGVLYQGIDNALLPASRSVLFGIKLNF